MLNQSWRGSDHGGLDAPLAAESVTNAMLSSGFITKPNFNREFLRITGESPSAWLDTKRPLRQQASDNG